MLETPNPYVTLSEITVDDFVKESDIKEFFMNSIDELLLKYEPGKPEHKPEVSRQMKELTQKRMEAIENQMRMQQKKQLQPKNIIELTSSYEKKLSEQTQVIHSLMQENTELNAKVSYLEKKISELIQKSINEKKNSL